MKKITIKDIAREANVSPSTVSRVVNKSAPVSRELEERVLEIIGNYGYSPDAVARSLRRGFADTVAFVVPDITNPFFSLIIKGAEDFFKKYNISLIVCGSNHSAKEEERILDNLLSKKVDGLLFIGAGNESLELHELLSEFKIVFVDRAYSDIDSPYVVSNNYEGMKEVVKYLVQTGHKSFVLLNGEKGTYSATERLKGFVDTLNEFGIDSYETYFGQFTYECGVELVNQLKDIPDAIVCGNDLIAYGAIDALEERGITVPEQVSVTGFDDLPFSKHYKPSLTTVKQPFYDMGYESAKILWLMINGKVVKRKRVVLDTKLIVRDSAKVR
ncbi:MAG TPA: LacI family DNA-binding transcriptional regulator [Fervidobacterium sp.]|nr:LacI family DNA-binding transcriptional regulator [Fervidobacterium sp.]